MATPISLSTPGLFPAIFGLTLLCYLVVAIRRRFFHPLSRYPGPWIAAISEVWYVRAWTSGKYPFILEEIHNKYGDIVRIAPNELSFGSAAAYKDIYGQVFKDKQAFLKSEWYNNGRKEPGLVTVRDPLNHRRQKKMLAPGFSSRSLRGQEAIVHMYVDQFLQQVGGIGAPDGPGISMDEAFNWLTFDIIGDLAFGQSFGAVANGKTHPWVSVIFESTYLQMLTGIRKRFPPLNLALPFIIPGDVPEKIKEHMQFTHERVMKRIELRDSLQRDDFFSHLLKKGDISEEEMKSQAMTLISAGSETTATSLTGAVYFLLRNAESLQKLMAEIRSSFKSADDITGDNTNALPYLRAVVEESLRIFPPVSFGLPRDSPGAMVDGHYIPSGVVVSVPPWVTQRDPRLWDEPTSFKPERWLGDQSQASKDAFQPFSQGPRACIGINLAYLELRVILAKLAWVYDWELVNKDLDFMKEIRLYFMWAKPPLLMRFHPRTDTSAT